MLIGFSDDGARERVLTEIRRLYRRVAVSSGLDQAGSVPLIEGSRSSAAWLSHGGVEIGHLNFTATLSASPSRPIGSRRCLVPCKSQGPGLWMLGGVWQPIDVYDHKPCTFRLVEAEGEFVKIAPENWRNWLDPERDVRPMLRGRKDLVVPGHH